MSLSMYADIANAVKTAMKGWSPLLERVTTYDEIPNAPQAGKITVPRITSVTAFTPTDGTLATNGVNSDGVDLTYVDQAVAFKFAASQAKSKITDPNFVAAVVASTKDAFLKAIQEVMVDDLIAGTPGLSQTLPAGQLNFTTDGTDAETRENIRIVNKAIAFLRATNTSGDNPITAVAPYESWANIYSLANVIPGVTLADGADRPMLWGVPLFALEGDASLAGANEPTFYAFAKDAIGIAAGDVIVTHDLSHGTVGDGFYAIEFQMPYGHALIRAAGTSEILNGAS